jgi:tetratricopeptide (TPR) repeat protein
MHYYLGQYDLAEQALRNAIELTPNAHISWMNLGDILYVAGREEEAHSAFAKAKELATVAIEVNPNSPEAMMDLAWIEAMLGEEALAFESIDSATALAPDDPYADYVRGLIALHFDDRDAALESLRAATAKGYPTTILKAEPHLSSLRDDSRFRQIVGLDTKGRNQ